MNGRDHQHRQCRTRVGNSYYSDNGYQPTPSTGVSQHVGAYSTDWATSSQSQATGSNDVHKNKDNKSQEVEVGVDPLTLQNNTSDLSSNISAFSSSNFTEVEDLPYQLEKENERVRTLENSYEKLLFELNATGAVNLMPENCRPSDDVRQSEKTSTSHIYCIGKDLVKGITLGYIDHEEKLKLKKLKQENEKLRRNLEDSDSSLKQVIYKLELERQSVEKLTRSKKDCDKKLNDYESEVRANKKIIRDLEHENQLLCREIERCRFENESLKKKLKATKSANCQFETNSEILMKEIQNNKEDYYRKLTFLEDNYKKAEAKCNQLEEENQRLEANVSKLEGEAEDLRLEVKKKADQICFLNEQSLITREKSRKEMEENMKRLSVNFGLEAASKTEEFNQFLDEKKKLIQNYEDKIEEMEKKIRNELDAKFQLREQHNKEMSQIHSAYSEKCEKLEMNFEKKLKLKDEAIYMAHLKAHDIQTECNRRIEEMISVMKCETDEIRALYEEAARGAGDNMNKQLSCIYENFKRVLKKQQRDLSELRQYGRSWNRDSAQENSNMGNEEDRNSGVTIEEIPD